MEIKMSIPGSWPTDELRAMAEIARTRAAELRAELSAIAAEDPANFLLFRSRRRALRHALAMAEAWEDALRRKLAAERGR